MRRYVSTRDSLEALYDRVSPGGLVYIDDYGAYTGAADGRTAVWDSTEGSTAGCCLRGWPTSACLRIWPPPAPHTAQFWDTLATLLLPRCTSQPQPCAQAAIGRCMSSGSGAASAAPSTYSLCRSRCGQRVHEFICTCAERVVPGSVTQRVLCLLHSIWLSKAARARMRFGCLAGAPQHGCSIPLRFRRPGDVCASG